jgi:hypothetical protein
MAMRRTYLSGTSRWQDSGLKLRIVETADGQESFDPPFTLC